MIKFDQRWEKRVASGRKRTTVRRDFSVFPGEVHALIFTTQDFWKPRYWAKIIQTREIELGKIDWKADGFRSQNNFIEYIERCYPWMTAKMGLDSIMALIEFELTEEPK